MSKIIIVEKEIEKFDQNNKKRVTKEIQHKETEVLGEIKSRGKVINVR